MKADLNMLCENNSFFPKKPFDQSLLSYLHIIYIGIESNMLIYPSTILISSTILHDLKPIIIIISYL